MIWDPKVASLRIKGTNHEDGRFLMQIKALSAALMLAVATSALATQAKAADIVDTAVEAGNFTTLTKALEAAGLVETLRGEGPFTVFAPTDRAFEGVGSDTLNSLLQPENRDKLRQVLTYHVVPGRVMAADVMGNQQHVETVEGSNVYIQGVAGTVLIGNAIFEDRTKYAEVTQANIEADNGVIHVIDKVLMPPQM
jgi:uncharacterized surface protein with fasciclin (FAS1) repeats